MRRVLRNLSQMGAPAYRLLSGGLMVANILMICALILLVAFPFSTDTYYFHRVSQAMRENASFVLFVVILASAYAEEKTKSMEK